MIPLKVFPFGVRVTATSAGAYLSKDAVAGVIVGSTGVTSPTSIVTLPLVLVTVPIFPILPSPKAPPSLNATGVVVFADTLFNLNVMFAKTPSAVIASSVSVSSANRKLILPSFALLEKFTLAFVTIGPAATDTTSNNEASYPR